MDLSPAPPHALMPPPVRTRPISGGPAGLEPLRRDDDGSYGFRPALQSITAFWLAYFVLITLRSVVLQMDDFWGLFGKRCIAGVVGIALTCIVYLALRVGRTASLNRKAILAAIVCLPVSTAFAGFNFAIFYVIAPLDSTLQEMAPEFNHKSPGEIALQMVGDGLFSWYFLFAAWAAFYVAWSYAGQLRAADQRAALLARDAQEAQLRALRYQINPHFLFNTLNSLSSLILRERTDVAEQMILNLSRFFRASLSTDPTSDLPLAEEIDLQRLYLDIERVRFPDRLRVEIDVDEDVAAARVPAMILQPVLENAIKYGVARSREPVTVRVEARRQGDRLRLLVSDDGSGGDPGAPGQGSGVGLRNVCDRLSARYGGAAQCRWGPTPPNGFAVELTLPITGHD